MAFLLPFIDTRKTLGNVQQVTEDSQNNDEVCTQGSETEIHEAEYNQTPVSYTHLDVYKRQHTHTHTHTQQCQLNRVKHREFCQLQLSLKFK